MPIKNEIIQELDQKLIASFISLKKKKKQKRWLHQDNNNWLRNKTNILKEKILDLFSTIVSETDDKILEQYKNSIIKTIVDESIAKSSEKILRKTLYKQQRKMRLDALKRITEEEFQKNLKTIVKQAVQNTISGKQKKLVGIQSKKTKKNSKSPGVQSLNIVEESKKDSQNKFKPDKKEKYQSMHTAIFRNVRPKSQVRQFKNATIKQHQDVQKKELAESLNMQLKSELEPFTTERKAHEHKAVYDDLAQKSEKYKKLKKKVKKYKDQIAQLSAQNDKTELKEERIWVAKKQELPKKKKQVEFENVTMKQHEDANQKQLAKSLNMELKPKDYDELVEQSKQYAKLKSQIKLLKKELAEYKKDKTKDFEKVKMTINKPLDYEQLKTTYLDVNPPQYERENKSIKQAQEDKSARFRDVRTGITRKNAQSKLPTKYEMHRTFISRIPNNKNQVRDLSDQLKLYKNRLAEYERDKSEGYTLEKTKHSRDVETIDKTKNFEEAGMRIKKPLDWERLKTTHMNINPPQYESHRTIINRIPKNKMAGFADVRPGIVTRKNAQSKSPTEYKMQHTFVNRIPKNKMADFADVRPGITTRKLAKNKPAQYKSSRIRVNKLPESKSVKETPIKQFENARTRDERRADYDKLAQKSEQNEKLKRQLNKSKSKVAQYSTENERLQRELKQRKSQTQKLQNQLNLFENETRAQSKMPARKTVHKPIIQTDLQRNKTESEGEYVEISQQPKTFEDQTKDVRKNRRDTTERYLQEQVTEERSAEVFRNNSKGDTIVFETMCNYAKSKNETKLETSLNKYFFGISEERGDIRKLNEKVQKAVKRAIKDDVLENVRLKKIENKLKYRDNDAGTSLIQTINAEGKVIFKPEGEFSGVVSVERRDNDGNLISTAKDVIEFKNGEPIAISVASTGNSRIGNLAALKIQAAENINSTLSKSAPKKTHHDIKAMTSLTSNVKRLSKGSKGR